MNSGMVTAISTVAYTALFFWALRFALRQTKVLEKNREFQIV